MEKKRILIVDDQNSVRATMAAALKSDNYEIDVAESGAKAIGYVERMPYDLIITDYSMPEMNGLELTKKIKSRYPATSILIVTASESAHDLLKREGTAFFPKPFKILEFQNRVRDILNGVEYKGQTWKGEPVSD